MDAPSPAPAPDRRLSVAPMMKRTDRHFRMFLRRLTRRTLLYTEMIPLGAILHGDRERFLGHDPAERPLALQVGGSDPAGLARAARLAEERGYDEINLNCGCPSEPVQRGAFGAVLMRRPALVAECVAAMRGATSLPVTVKVRIGLDGDSNDAFLDDFVGAVAEAGCRDFAVHARTAWLSGLSPKENRTVPPLDHDRVRRLARARPDLGIVVNGGIRTLEEAKGFLDGGLAGAMIGRAAWDDPWILAGADKAVFGAPRTCASREEAARGHVPYVARTQADGVPFRRLGIPLSGLYRGHPGAKRWRRALAEAGSIDAALAAVAGETPSGSGGLRGAFRGAEA